jgi:hypothetical protein
MNQKLLILSIGRDIAESAEKQLGRKADAVLTIPELVPEAYSELRRNVYQYLKKWQSEPIELVLSGPVAFALTLGQIIGLNHFDLKVYHYDSSQRAYLAITAPTRNEIV